MSAETPATEFLTRLFDEAGPPPRVDWERYRLMQLIPGTAGAAPAEREQLLARGFVELGRGRFDDEAERRSLASLRALVGQIIGPRWRLVPHDNPMVAALAAGPAPSAPPNLARLLSAVAEILGRAQAVTIAAEADTLGERLMTLLFVDGAYVGFLPGRMDGGTSSPRAQA